MKPARQRKGKTASAILVLVNLRRRLVLARMTWRKRSDLANATPQFHQVEDLG